MNGAGRKSGKPNPWNRIACRLSCDICAALTDAEVSAAGTPLKRGPAGACRFGSERYSVYLTMHSGGGSQFETYASQAWRQFHEAHQVAGVGLKASR